MHLYRLNPIRIVHQMADLFVTTVQSAVFLTFLSNEDKTSKIFNKVTVIIIMSVLKYNAKFLLFRLLMNKSHAKT